MRSYRNPFRYRTSEQESFQGLRRFLRTFGSGALDMLPEQVWDRPVLLQSAPGAGKTSLMRTFSADSLAYIAHHPDELPELHARMTDVGAIEDGRIRILGVRLPLKRDYRAIDDLRLAPDRAVKVFFRLLDAHLVRGLVEAFEQAVPHADRELLRIEPSSAGVTALERLGGPSVEGLLAWSRTAELDLLDHLDSVLPPALADIGGHHAPYAVRALSGATLWHGEEQLQLRVLVMFDDGQDVGRRQRSALLDAVADRELVLHRWFAERYQALTADEVVADGEPHRAYTVVRLEAEARQLGDMTRRGRRTRRFERLLLQISDLRASNVLLSEAEEERPFSELFATDLEPDEPRLRSAIARLDEGLATLTDGKGRYDEWLALARTQNGYDGAMYRRVVRILIERDLARGQDTLFTVPLTEKELKLRWGSGLTEAAALFLRREVQLPFYAGSDRLTKLASDNIEQHINLSGQLFEEVLARITLNRPLALDPVRQDAIVTHTSEMVWRDIPRRLPNGREIQRLLLNVAGLCRRDTYRDTAPYPPGATGTAISMRDRQRLLDPDWRRTIAGADELFVAVASAIGHNMLRADLDYAVKNDRWMVLYLNRMLCVRFGLPLGFGGFRERSLEELCAWMAETRSPEGNLVEPPIQEQFAL